MNLPRPDSGNFNRLIVSLGGAAMALAVVVPWLFLREDGVLTIRASELSLLTDTARRALIDRQETLADIQTVWLVISPLLFVIGLLLLIWGAVRLHRQQSVEDRTLSAQAETAERLAKLEPQTEEERQDRIVADQKVVDMSGAAVMGGDGPDDTAARRVSPVPSVEGSGGTGKRVRDGVSSSEDSKPDPRSASDDRYRQAREMERRVFDRLRDLTPPGFDFVTEVKTSRDADRIFLDGVFTSLDRRQADVVVEVKVMLGSRVPFVRRFVDGLLATLARYRTVMGRPCIGWLIVVVMDGSTTVVADKLHRASHPDVVIDVVRPDRLDDLERLPTPRASATLF